MKKFYLLTKTLLVAVCLLGGANSAWADLAETEVVNCNFENSEVLFSTSGRVSTNANAADPTSGANHVYQFTSGSKAGNVAPGAFAYYNFNSLTKAAEKVDVSFDCYLPSTSGQIKVSIGDATYRTSSIFTDKGAWSYNGTGAIFVFGTERGKLNGSTNENYASVNGTAIGSTTTLKADQILGLWVSISVSVDITNKKVSYTIKNKSTNAVLVEETNKDFFNATAAACSQIDIQTGVNEANAYIDNIVITKFWDYQDTYTSVKAEYDTKVASLDAAGQAYWTANVTSAASVTDEASYNAAVAALPTTYIAAVKAQTTAGTDMTELMPTGNAGWTCSQGNGPASYQSTGATETYSDGSTYAKFAAGNIMSQSISGLSNGYYRVKFYGVVNAANNVSTVSGSDLVQAYANSATLDIDVIKQNSCTPTDYLRTVIAQVSDGTLTYGLKAKDGVTDAGNWAVAKIYSLTYLGSTLYDYTINYKFNDATLSSTEGSAAYGETVNATSPITISDTKYYATSTTSMVIGEEPNVLNVTLRKAETWSYTVRAVNSTAGVINDNLASGSVIEGEVGPKVFFPRYVLKGTTLYCSNTGTVAYSATVTPNANDYVYDVNYNLTPVNNVAFYTEAEDVTGVSKGSNVDRASMGKMGYTGDADTYKDVTTLTPGKYILYSRFQNGNDAARTYNFKVGGVVVHTGSASKGTNNDTYSSEFTVNTPSVLSFASGGSDNGGVDYFYLVKTAESVTIGTSGFATFSSPYALNFGESDVTPYCASAAAGGTVTMTKLTDDIAANTGLFLKGDNGADTYVIPVVATAGSVPATNYLKPTTGENIYNGSKFQYVYANQSAGYAFYKVGSTLAPAKGKAYLETAASAAGARMTIMFDDEVTGIENLTPALSEGKGAYYDLQGRRVAQPTKGLYIVNGRKVVVK